MHKYTSELRADELGIHPLARGLLFYAPSFHRNIFATSRHSNLSPLVIQSMLTLTGREPSSSGLRGSRRTYCTILEWADHALFKMSSYDL
jgi:hypothetical protein